MSAVIVCRAGLNGPENTEETKFSGPSRLRLARNTNSCRERGAYTASAICTGAVFPAKRTVSAITCTAGFTQSGSVPHHDAKSVRVNSWGHKLGRMDLPGIEGRFGMNTPLILSLLLLEIAAITAFLCLVVAV